MKRKLIIITIAALVATACSTNMQTAGNYVDDLYYWPGDDVPEISNEELAELEQSTKPDDNIVIISELGKNEKGAQTLDNYIYAEEEPDWYNEVQAYNLSNTQSEGQDTIFIPDENNGEYVVNNYYINDHMSYADRIRRFHDPYYYDPHVSFSFNMGWGAPYYSSYYSWNSWHYDPWYYDPWYSSAWGYSPYYGSSWYYNRWHSPYYYSYYRPYSYYGSYYGGYYGNYYPHYYVDNKDYVESNRRSRRPNTTYSGGGVAGGRSVAGNYRDSETINKSARTSNRRNVVGGSGSELAQKSASSASRSERAVLMEKRRSTASASRSASNVSSDTKSNATRANSAITTPRRNVRSSYSSASTGSTTSNRSYTPSYNKPRTNTRATYNRSNNRSSEDVQRSSTRSRSSYSIPSTERTSKSATYRSSSSKTPTKSYSTGTRSTPSRSKSYSSGSSPRSRSSYSSGSSSRSNRSSYSSGSSSRSSRSSYSSGSSTRSSGSSYSGGSSSRSSSSGSSSSGRRR